MPLSQAELVDLQLKMELEAKAESMKTLKENNDRLKASGQNSKTIGGLGLHKRILGDAVTLMTEDLSYYFRNTDIQKLPLCYRLLLNNQRVSPFIEPEDMAHIALVTMLDSIGDGRLPTVPLTKVYSGIGQRIEDQARMKCIEQVDPQFFERLKAMHLKKADSYSRKMKKVSAEIDFREMDNEDLFWEKWTPEERVSVGSWAAWIIQQTTEWFQDVKLPPSKYDKFGTTRYLMFSTKGAEERDQIEKMRINLAFTCLPMLTQPREWGIGQRGGYLLGGPGFVNQMIHGHNVETVPSQKAIDFLNNLQRQRYVINPYILDIAKILLKGNHSIGAFKSYQKIASENKLDPAIWNLPDTDDRKKNAFMALMAKKSSEDKHKAQALSPVLIVDIANRVHNYGEAFYMPWFFDTRLRAYPTSQLHCQGADYHKALIVLETGGDVTRENLEDVKRFYHIALANTYGNKVDKLSFDGRIKWAEEYIATNIHLIIGDSSPLHATKEPSFSLWTAADEPFQHLAILHEYNNVVLNWRPGTTCHVPLGFDATCSGLQLLGSFVRDPITCGLVNVIPDTKPNDAYGAVAKKAREILSDPDRWTQLNGRQDDVEHAIPIDRIDRSVAKKVVMLIPYGGTYDTLCGHVRDAVKDWGISIRDAHTLTKALIQGMSEAVPGFSALNKWFKEAAAEVMKSGADKITWTTPTGSKIVQKYNVPSTRPIRTVALGVSNYKDPKHYQSTRASVVDDNGKVEVNARKNATALAANWTHSMDAAVLQEAFHDFDQPFTTVHDCLYAPAAVLPEALKRLRKAFVTVVTYDALHQFLEDNEIDIGLPPIGDADVTSAEASEYLFS